MWQRSNFPLVVQRGDPMHAEPANSVHATCDDVIRMGLGEKSFPKLKRLANV